MDVIWRNRDVFFYNTVDETDKSIMLNLREWSPRVTLTGSLGKTTEAALGRFSGDITDLGGMHDASPSLSVFSVRSFRRA